MAPGLVILWQIDGFPGKLEAHYQEQAAGYFALECSHLTFIILEAETQGPQQKNE